jgi:deazaflavin-dependent oxidoreductase (nitroreductase family)
MPIPRVVGRFNRRFLNPLVSLIAGRIPPLAIVEHTGRVSGRAHRTPIMAFGTDGGLAIALTYGSRTDWVRNVMTASGARISRLGHARRYASPTIVRGAEGIRTMPVVVRPVLRLLRVSEFLLLRESRRGDVRADPGDPSRAG